MFGADVSSFVLKPKFEGDILESHVTDDVTLFCKKKNFPKIYANYISFDSKLNADKSLQYNYGLKMLGSQDVRTVMTLGKLKCSDVLFCTYSKHQMLMLSEHQPALAENKPSFHVLKVKIS